MPREARSRVPVDRAHPTPRSAHLSCIRSWHQQEIFRYIRWILHTMGDARSRMSDAHFARSLHRAWDTTRARDTVRCGPAAEGVQRWGGRPSARRALLHERPPFHSDTHRFSGGVRSSFLPCPPGPYMRRMPGSLRGTRRHTSPETPIRNCCPSRVSSLQMIKTHDNESIDSVSGAERLQSRIEHPRGARVCVLLAAASLQGTAASPGRAPVGAANVPSG